jgi:hypothetical protein
MNDCASLRLLRRDPHLASLRFFFPAWIRRRKPHQERMAQRFESQRRYISQGQTAYKVCRFGIGRTARLTVIPHPGKKGSRQSNENRFHRAFVPGHFNPMSAVARQLQSREQDVVMLSLS